MRKKIKGREGMIKKGLSVVLIVGVWILTSTAQVSGAEKAAYSVGAVFSDDLCRLKDVEDLVPGEGRC